MDLSWEALGNALEPYLPLLIQGLIAVILLILMAVRIKKKLSSGTEKRRKRVRWEKDCAGAESKPSSAYDFTEKETAAGFCIPEEEEDGNEAPISGSTGSGSGKGKDGTARSAAGGAKDKARQRKRWLRDAEVFYRYEGGEERKIICSRCGVENAAGKISCGLCGARLEE